MCVPGLPVACVPLWQPEQPFTTPAWSNCPVVQVLVEWQLSQLRVVGMCVVGLPVAVVPLWQAEQVPITCV